MGPPLLHHLDCFRPEAHRHWRLRRCLLKGCERLFRPHHPQMRYCSADCRLQARRWRRRKASQQYRATEQGRAHHRQQQQRYRQRHKEVTTTEHEDAAGSFSLRVGQRPAPKTYFFSERMCNRPGCYVIFPVTHVQNQQRFCSVACRLALRRVLDREARYRQRRRRQRPSCCRRPPPRRDIS